MRRVASSLSKYYGHCSQSIFDGTIGARFDPSRGLVPSFIRQSVLRRNDLPGLRRYRGNYKLNFHGAPSTVFHWGIT
jgi:hypothetical protein